jgi:GR25 family glycosyltransferase involved in LPS biosynthesis
MKTFIIHYSKLFDRKKHMLQEFQKQNIINYEFVEKYNKEDLHESDKLLFDPFLKHSMISIINKTFYVYQQIVEKYDSALILEDDVVLCDNFTDILNKYINELPENYDMLFIGNGCNLHIE